MPLQRDDNTSIGRREFLAATGVAAVASQLPSRLGLAEGTPASTPMLHVHPRYHRWHVDPGVDWVETNTAAATLDWKIPLSQTALVLVDVWNAHYLRDASQRANDIIQSKFVPLLAACRQAGMPIIHAPSPPNAMAHPNWVGRGKPAAAKGPASKWPPAEFRSKSGQFASYRRPTEPREPELRTFRNGLTIHPLAAPVGPEPVIATGDELHALCESKGILFLFFAGFNTNACILVRDYGTLAMSQRGYETILLRDCTTGMETRETQPTLAQTNGAILFLEMFGQYSASSEEIVASLNDAR